MATKSTSTAQAPVANLRETKRQMAQSRQRHPAGSQKPAAKAAPAKAAAKPAAKPAAEKVTYAATGRGSVTRTQQSASPLVAAVDVCIAGRRGQHFAKGVVVAFYADKAKAEGAAASINAGAAGADWTDAIVTTAVKGVS